MGFSDDLNDILFQSWFVSSVEIAPFFMGETEVTWKDWNAVLIWAKLNGYEFTNDGKGFSDNHPAVDLSWHDAVKWCNAKSEKEGVTPCYRIDDLLYRNGENNSVICDWTADGYRLPTEAEWEKAARGGLVGKEYPNGNFLSKNEANFEGDRAIEVKSCLPNGYGLYDIAGNVSEWCWDWFSISDTIVTKNPRGPVFGETRVVRGGGWDDSFLCCRVTFRYGSTPDCHFCSRGVRVVRANVF